MQGQTLSIESSAGVPPLPAARLGAELRKGGKKRVSQDKGRADEQRLPRTAAWLAPPQTGSPHAEKPKNAEKAVAKTAKPGRPKCCTAALQSTSQAGTV
mmetsp:Transcript_70905/g.178755  ORF Transcript_70905/g.178755 Transcript_70905/m.178755 type:complete len:99 (-) Transcript_70905:564-860(-)